MASDKAKSSAAADVHAGFIPLVDCAPLVVAKELGFDREEGVTLHLHREVSWANIRDKVDVGLYDCAHMLAPLPIAASIGIGRAAKAVIAPMMLSLNGNTITVSRDLSDQMGRADPIAAASGGKSAATALAAVITQREKRDLAPLTFGMVFPFSCHNYDLRDWLASAGIDPDHDVNLVVVPPPLMSESLRSGRIDGFCAGEPWGSVAVADGSGIIVASKSQIWSRSPEKALGVGLQWAERNPERLECAIRALVRASAWLDTPANRRDAAKLLAKKEYVGAPCGDIERVLVNGLEFGAARRQVADPDEIIFFRGHATFPSPLIGQSLVRQMQRWRQVASDIDIEAISAKVFRPDLYRSAVGPLGAPFAPPPDEADRAAHTP